MFNPKSYVAVALLWVAIAAQPARAENALGRAISNVFSALFSPLSAQPAEADPVGWNQQGSTPKTPPSNASCMSTGSEVGAAELSRVTYLQFPQSAKAIDSLLGVPQCWNNRYDFYRVVGTGAKDTRDGRYLVITYRNGNAINYALPQSF